MSAQPAILFVHGAYHPPVVYSQLTTVLKDAGFKDVTAPRLASLGSNAHGVAVPDEDAAVIRAAAEPYFAQGRKVVVLAHSIGGFLATAAIKGFTVAERAEQGKKGGFAAVVYMNSTLPVTHEETVMAVCDPDSGTLFDADVREDGKVSQFQYARPISKTQSGIRRDRQRSSLTWLQMVTFFKTDDASKDKAFHFFYSLAPRELAENAFSQLEPFNTQAFFATATVLAADLENFPRTYIVGEKDYVVPLAQQERIIANTSGMKEVRLQDCGHSPFLTHVEEVVRVVKDVVTEIA